jgi:hypothetical protein
MLIYNEKTTSAGDVNVIQIGISTSSTTFSGGFTTYAFGQQTYSGTGTNAVIGGATHTFSVPTSNTYYFLQQTSDTLAVINNTADTYIQYTRIA